MPVEQPDKGESGPAQASDVKQRKRGRSVEGPVPQEESAPGPAPPKPTSKPGKGTSTGQPGASEAPDSNGHAQASGSSLKRQPEATPASVSDAGPAKRQRGSGAAGNGSAAAAASGPGASSGGGDTAAPTVQGIGGGAASTSVTEALPEGPPSSGSSEQPAGAQKSGGGRSADAAEGPSGGQQREGGGVEEQGEEEEERVELGGVVRRSVAAIVECLACDLCHCLLDDPVTARECMHIFCRECVEGALAAPGGAHKCPACVLEARQTLLGANPWAHARLQPDFVLDALIRKILPEDVRQHLIWQRVQFAHARPRGVALGARAPPAQWPSRAKVPQRPMPASEALALFLHPQQWSAAAAAAVPWAKQQWRLEMPYVRVPKRMPLAVLARYVAARLDAPEQATVDLFCRDTLLQPAGTVEDMAKACWAAESGEKAIVEIGFAAGKRGYSENVHHWNAENVADEWIDLSLPVEAKAGQPAAASNAAAV